MRMFPALNDATSSRVIINSMPRALAFGDLPTDSDSTLSVPSSCSIRYIKNNPFEGLTEGYESRLLSIGCVMFLHFLNEWANNFFAGLGIELHVESYAFSLYGGNELHGVTPSQG